MKKLLLITLSAILVTGCATQSFTLNNNNAATPDQNTMQTFFISGLGQEQEINAASVCGGADKVAKVEAKHEFVDGLLGFITLGIYTPRHAKVYCIK